jgi:hypothetical protein
MTSEQANKAWAKYEAAMTTALELADVDDARVDVYLRWAAEWRTYLSSQTVVDPEPTLEERYADLRRRGLEHTEAARMLMEEMRRQERMRR